MPTGYKAVALPVLTMPITQSPYEYGQLFS